MSKGIQIGGFGIADHDGDEIWITIRTPLSETRIMFPANRSELVREAFTCAIQSALNDITEDNSAFIGPITIE